MGPSQVLAVALALVLAGSGAMFWYFDGKLDEANERVTQAEGSRAKEEQSRKGFEAAATMCGESVGKLAAAAAAQKAEHEKIMKQSQAQTAQAEEMVAIILSNARPVGMTECEAMKFELDAEIERRAHEIDDRHPNS
jgi:hypothetical protein